jgi:hypothetical protein
MFLRNLRFLHRPTQDFNGFESLTCDLLILGFFLRRQASEAPNEMMQLLRVVVAVTVNPAVLDLLIINQNFDYKTV